MASIEVGIRGQVWEQTSCVVAGSSQPENVELLHRWEKTISLYRTASGVDISDGILAATVLEHSPEAYQNILKQAPPNVRASYSAMRGGLREYAEKLRRCDGTAGSSVHQPQSTGPVPLEVDQTRAASGFSSGKDGGANPKGKSKDGKRKGKRKARRARIRNQ